MDAAPPPPPHHHQAARPTGAVWSLVPWVRALRDHRAAAHAHEEKRRIIPRRTQLYTADYRQRQPSRGDVKLRTLRSALAWFDSIGFARSKHQRLFHESMLSACVRHLYDGEDFAGQYLKILEKNGWNEARQEVMICCPRRFGKTWAVGQYVAAYLYAVPRAEICIFSPSRRQSEKMLELVKTFLTKLPGAASRITKSNSERLWLKGDDGAEDTRKVSSYPSKVSTLKGVGGDLIICEEAAAMDTAVFFEVVVPLLELDKTALICISTILDSFNFYSKLLDLKGPDGTSFFVVHSYVLACEACLDAGTPESCSHMFHDLPPWQSARKHKARLYVQYSALRPPRRPHVRLCARDRRAGGARVRLDRGGGLLVKATRRRGRPAGAVRCRARPDPGHSHDRAGRLARGVCRRRRRRRAPAPRPPDPRTRAPSGVHPLRSWDNGVGDRVPDVRAGRRGALPPRPDVQRPHGAVSGAGGHRCAGERSRRCGHQVGLPRVARGRPATLHGRRRGRRGGLCVFLR